ncbi:MAG: YdiU family protein [Myxococcales bacterium]|nr:YdiU family protein [Myxococcales bacterium]
MPFQPHYTPEPVFSRLGEGFYDVVQSAEFPEHIVRFKNERWAERMGLGELDESAWIQHFGRFEPLDGNLPQPLALRYHGHQFRNYNPNLGDGRGFLFAQLRDPLDQRLLDLATKGSGQTPWSRGADGRLTLKGGFREALATEMLEALGVYTSKTFSLVETGESLTRYDEPSPTRACVLVRLGHSHVRFGSFQRHAYLEHHERLRQLVEFSVEHYMPHLQDEKDLPSAFLREVVMRSADLCASWMAAGFVHGVLNTDNMNICGESFDYGPYRFLPHYDPHFTAAYFDDYGLYAYGRQPVAVFWNLQQLALSLQPLADSADLVKALQFYEDVFAQAMTRHFLHRLGLLEQGHKKDMDLVSATFAFLEASQIEFEQFFFDWYGGHTSEARAKESPMSSKYRGEAFQLWFEMVGEYLPKDAKSLEHAYFQRPRPCGLLIDEIEALWAPVAQEDDWTGFQEKLAAIREKGEALGHVAADARYPGPHAASLAYEPLNAS